MERENARIVVLGAGFGGLTFCQKFRHPRAAVTLVDRQNHHLFQPLLYQVATAGLSAPEIAQPIRSILREAPRLNVLMETVREIRLRERQVVLASQSIPYDFLVLALGGVTSYFGHPEWEPFAPGLKSLDDAMRIRRNVLSAFERAETCLRPEEIERLLTIVVVGGGPTGVELAGAFAELARHVLARDFDRIDPRKARVVLIEASPRVLSHLPPELSLSAQAQLEQLGVEVRTSTRVLDLQAHRVETSGGTIHAANIIWAAGVGGNPLARTLGVDLDRAGRIKVLPDLSIPGFPEAFAIGDLAFLVDRHGVSVPGVSPAAMQEAAHVAGIIADELDAEPCPPPARPAYGYLDKGTMATIGRSSAVAKLGPLELSGFSAWLAWLGVHLLFLIGFRNKIAVLFQWAYSYFSYKRGARIITGAASDAASSETPPARTA